MVKHVKDIELAKETINFLTRTISERSDPKLTVAEVRADVVHEFFIDFNEYCREDEFFKRLMERHPKTVKAIVDMHNRFQATNAPAPAVPA